MRIFITGGAGCLGSELARYWVANGANVLVFDNFQTGDSAWLSPDLKLDVLEGSVTNRFELEKAFASFRPTHVIHAAASYANPDDWEGDLLTNGLGTLNVVRACESTDVEKIVYLQTALGYGRPKVSPIPLDHVLRPTTSYGISKVAGEMYVLAADIASSISLRLANICAPRLSIGPLPTFFKRLGTGDECVVTAAERDFLAVGDFLELIDQVLRHERPLRGAFNVSSGIGKSILDVFEAVAAEMKVFNPRFRTAPIGRDDVKSVVLSPEATEKTFGWTAKTDFEEAIRQQVGWFEILGVGSIRSHLKENHSIDGKSNE